MSDKIKTSDLFYDIPDYLKILFEDAEYPWEILAKIKDFTRTLVESGLPGFKKYSEKVLVGENVKIYPTATIEGWVVIGEGTEIRPGAFLRGNIITGKNCVIGNSTELKNSVLLDRVQVPHYNYVGDSVLGVHAHMGAGSICSNLKSDGKNVVIHGEENYDTGLRKIGGILGDGADIGCGCVLNPGTIVGQNTSVYPLTALRGIYPKDSIVKSVDNIVVKKK